MPRLILMYIFSPYLWVWQFSEFWENFKQIMEPEDDLGTPETVSEQSLAGSYQVPSIKKISKRV